MRSLIFAFMLGMVGLASYSVATACSCEVSNGPVSAQVASGVRESSAVFSAEVIEVENFMAGFEEYQATRLKVLKSWKGPHVPGDIVSTTTQTACCLCGIEVNLKQTLLVYVSGKQPYRLSDCSRTQSLNSASEDIKVLDGPQPRDKQLNSATPNNAFQRTLEDSHR